MQTISQLFTTSPAADGRKLKVRVVAPAKLTPWVNY